MVSSPVALKSSPNQSLTPLTTRTNAQGQVEIGGCSVVDLVARFASPLYIVDEASLRLCCQLYRDTLRQVYQGSSQVIYASKAWSNLALCRLVRQEGLGLDVASGGELYTALQAGATGADIYLHGNSKTADELRMAWEAGCTVVADSLYELQTLAQIANPERPARVMVRVNPGIDVHTHEYIRTGQIDSKFGLGKHDLPEIFTYLAGATSLHCTGIHAHVGSQIFDLQGHIDLAGVMTELWQQAQGLGLALSELNIGGGLGIRYVESDDPPSIPEWCEAVANGVQQAFNAAGIPLPKLLCEPGRSLVGSSTVTAYTVGSRKQIPVAPELPQGRTYVTVDGGMSDNPRPITYQAKYTAMLATEKAGDPERVTVAGKHCESGDIVLKDVMLPPLDPGDILLVLATGAYNASMSSNYNRYPRPAAVLVREGQAELILQRETYADLVRQDVVPLHLQS
ncbi:MAG: diaminopimelate decarboxylase [Cyanophyceae cyanobacterium]